jgi:hypothetical protein
MFSGGERLISQWLLASLGYLLLNNSTKTADATMPHFATQ